MIENNLENNEEDAFTEQVSVFEEKDPTTFEPTNVDEIQQRVINRLNQELGSNIENLTKCREMLDQVLLHKKSIEQSLSLASSTAPSMVREVVQEVEDISCNIAELSSRFYLLNSRLEHELTTAHATTNQMIDFVEKIEQFERGMAYINVINIVENLSKELEVSYEAEGAACIQHYQKLASLSCVLSTSKCNHLVTYLSETLHFWHQVLLEKYSKELEEIFKLVRWPFVSSNVLTSPPGQDTMNRFQTLIEYLIHIELPNQKEETQVRSTVSSEGSLSLPMVLLIRPLKKRFLYHFYGTRQTNRPDKPEWFLTQVLTWIRDHQTFVGEWIQPVYDKCNRKRSAKLELTQGLVQLASAKLHTELSTPAFEDDSLFAHAIDETLGFERELRDTYEYPPGLSGVVTVLTQASVFIKWIQMEKKYASEKIDTLLCSDDAWELLTPYKDEEEPDELCITNCADGFVSLLASITDRYSALPQPGHRLQFLDVQLELLDDFRVRMLQVLREEESIMPLEGNLPAILNTIGYLGRILTEWSELPHFISLFYYKSQSDPNKHPSSEKSHEHNMDTLDQVISSSLENNSKDNQLRQQQQQQQQHSYDETVFDEILALFNRMQIDLINTLCESIMLDVKARSREYRKDRWIAMPSPHELCNPSVSPTAGPMFLELSSKLHQLHRLLSKSLFSQAWRLLCHQLNQFLYEEVVLQNKFNLGGALQLQYDICRNLFPLLSHYGTGKPESKLGQMKAACQLLTLSKASAILLRDTLIREPDTLAFDSLREMGIHEIEPKEAGIILGLRTDLLQF